MLGGQAATATASAWPARTEGNRRAAPDAGCPGVGSQADHLGAVAALQAAHGTPAHVGRGDVEPARSGELDQVSPAPAPARVVLSGDALVTGHPTSRRRGPHLLPEMFHGDTARARSALDALADLDADLLLPGHGEPHHGPGLESLSRVAGPEYPATVCPRVAQLPRRATSSRRTTAQPASSHSSRSSSAVMAQSPSGSSIPWRRCPRRRAGRSTPPPPWPNRRRVQAG